LLNSLTVKFSSPAIVLQTLSALSPGGPPGSPDAIPLEDILFELGDGLTQDEGTVEAVIGRWWGPYLTDDRAKTEEASRMVVRLCEGLRDGRSVDVHGVVKGLSSLVSVPTITMVDAQEGITFADVIRSFDAPQTIAAYPTTLPLLISLLLVPRQTPVPPIAGLLPAGIDSAPWSNLASLLAVLSHLTTVPPDTIPLFTMPSAPPPTVFARIIEPPPSETAWSKLARHQAGEIQGAGLWNTLGLIQVLVLAIGLADTESTNDRGTEERVEIGRRATDMLERASALAPELVLVALEKLPVCTAIFGLIRADLQKPLPGPITTMHTRLLALYLSSTPNTVTSSQLVFHQMWQIDPANLLAVLLEFYSEDENNLGRVVEISLELKVSVWDRGPR
jgi:CCR4-NOT transcription complex subunit 1